MTERVGISTLIVSPAKVPDRLRLIEQDIRALIQVGDVLVTVQLVKPDAQDHKR